MRAVRTPAWLLIAGAELTLVRRSVLTVVMAAALPTAIGLLIVWAEGDTGRAGWGAAAGLLLVMLTALTAYVGGTTALAARRQQFVLKRLRTSGASDTAIVAGMLAPLALLTVVQTVVLFGIIAVADGAVPRRPGVLLLAAVAGTVVACVLAIATAAFTSAPELAQLTTSPIALAFLGGGFWAADLPPGDVAGAMVALPGVSVMQLARAGWDGAGPIGPAILALVLLATLGTAVAVRVFRWDPRRAG